MNTETYIQYGIPSDWVKIFETKNISATTFKNTPLKQLIDKYGIEKSQAKFVKDCLKRTPIDEEIAQQLLERNRYVCCLCKGQKSDAYIIHHITPYAKTQDNSYDNLAVLCPNDHDLAHREGQNLTNKISPEQIKKSKENWEKKVEELNVRIASQNGEISEADFINIPRVVELYFRLYKEVPNTKYSEELKSRLFLNQNGNINHKFLNWTYGNTVTPFMCFDPLDNATLSLHFEEAFIKILAKIEFTDLDLLLNKTSLKNDNLVGKFCFYVGGLYGNRPILPIDEKTQCCHLYFHRGKFFSEWIVDPKYLRSSSSIDRLANRTEYIVYGRIRSIGEKEWKGKKYIHYDIRPYLFGLPTKTKSRRPLIHYIDKDEYYDEFE